MQDNNNSNSMMSNGDPRSRSPERFANIRAAEERKLLARNNGHKPKKIIMEQTNIPIPEDDNEDGDKFSGRESGGAASTPVDADNTDATLLKKNDDEEKKSVTKRILDRVYTRYDVSQKSRFPFILLCTLCLLFFIVTVLLLIIWPYIPSYMRADVCTDPECFDVSKQIVGWADLKEPVCENPYKFSCGNFINEYRNHELYLINKGEWGANSHFEYEALNKVNAFISKLPNLPSMSSIQPMIKKIYSNCMNVRSEDRTEDNLQVLKNILLTARGWNILEQSGSYQWSLLENLPIVQVNFGVYPFYRVSIENGNITLSEGDLGLPDEQLYNYHRDHPIIIAYKQLIRDVHNSLKATTVSEADNFVENLFRFEKRIVESMRLARQKGSVSAMYRIYDVKSRAHSLPIDTTIQNMFSNNRLSDETYIKVKDLELIHQISVLVTSSEQKVLNNFVMWTLVRKFLPMMSYKIRSSLENFHRKLYGNQYNNLPWHFCTQLTHEWMRFGIETLRQNPRLIVADSTKMNRDDSDEDDYPYDEHLTKDQQTYEEELLRMMFYHLRNAFTTAISSASWIDPKFSEFVNHRLGYIRLQLGIPKSLLKNLSYVQQYYHDFIINDINFLQNIEKHWNMERKILQNLRSENMSEDDRIVYEMFSSSRNGDNRKLKYLRDINLVIVDQSVLREPYYHYKYPLSVNFARVGTDFASILLEAAFEIGEQYKELLFKENQYEDDIPDKNTLEGDALKCVNGIYSVGNSTFSTPGIVKKTLFSRITSANIAHRALNSFIEKLENEPSDFDPKFIKELNIDKRQNGLNKYSHEEIYSLSFLQKHCAVISDEYRYVKVFAEGKIPEREMFDIMWKNVPVLSESLDCYSSKIKLCDNIL